MTMIKKVARALALNEGARMVGPGQCRATREFGWKGDGVHFEQYVEAHWKEQIGAAAFAIEAMREPTFDPEHPTQAQIDAVSAVINSADETAAASGYIMTKLLMRALRDAASTAGFQVPLDRVTDDL